MEENIGRNIPLPVMVSGCVSELTRTNSDSSAVTIVDISKDFSLHNVNATPPGPSIVWTDEKHSLYLDSLEASFVNQLHRSIGLHGRSQEIIWGPYPSHEVPANGYKSSHQFMVLQDGCWQKINSERNEPLLESTADSHFVQESPWIRHFKSAGKQHSVGSHDLREHGAPFSKQIHVRGNATFSCGLPRSSEQHPALCHQDLVGSAIEVSDQNFVGEDQREKSSREPMAKRLKMVGVDASSYDQVVPFEKSNTRDVSTGREEPMSQELLSENPDNFVCPKSDIHYFLRGS